LRLAFFLLEIPMAKARGEGARKPAQTQEVQRSSANTAECISRVIAAVETQLEQAKFKATIADYIRLLQIEREYAKDKPRDIEVTWVESVDEKKSSGK
jgi:hypothetical protein